MNTSQLKLLQESFNRDLSLEEEKALKEAMTNDSELRSEAEQMKKLAHLMNEVDYSFDCFFTDKVMNRIAVQDEYAPLKDIYFAFSRIALPGLAAAAILVLITMLGGNSFSFDSLMGVEALQPEYLTDFLIYGH